VLPENIKYFVSYSNSLVASGKKMRKRKIV